MNEVDDRELGFMHDAVVLGIRFQVDDYGVHYFNATFKCHDDAGSERWNGKRVEVSATDVFCSRMRSCGYVSGPDSVSDLSHSISNSFAADVTRLIDEGMKRLNAFLAIQLNSGTLIELAATEIRISIAD